MTAAEKMFPTSIELQNWSTLCLQYPDEWVCLVDVELTSEGALQAARMLGHDHSAQRLLEQLGPPPHGATIVHTWGRRLTFPRLVMTDELRDYLRSHP
jgi:hypothetical protein